MESTVSDSLRALIGPRVRVRSVFQPIVDLQGGHTVGYEALARFPDLPDSGPNEVFARARAAGVLGDLDWECRRAAITGALTGGLRAPMYLFVNVEPSVLGSPPPWRVDPEVVAEMVATVPTVIELTERALLTDPSAVLWAMNWARDRSCLVALDDVGANPDSVAMLDVVRPDIIKLDGSMLADDHTDDQRRTLRAVWDHVARTGARILCEGVESERDLDRARACGASLVQGFALGRPDELAIPGDLLAAVSREPTRLGIEPTARLITPTDPAERLLGDGRAHVSSVGEIARVAAAFGDSRLDPDVDGCVLLSLHDPALFTPWLARRYAALATSKTLVGVIGVGEDLPVGVRGSHVQPMRDHLAFVRLDTEFSVAIVARDLGDTGPVADRRYEWMITSHHTEVIEVARSLLRRLAPVQEPRAVGGDGSDVVRSALSDIAAVAVRVIPGVESAGLTLRTTSGGLVTPAASDQYPFLLDQLQLLYREGPSLQARQDHPVLRIDDFGLDGRWMSFRAAATVSAPVASLLSFRLFTGRAGTGFLTLYSHATNAFDDTALDNAHAVAGYAAVVWTRLRAEGESGGTDVASEFGRTALSDDLDAAVAELMRRGEVSAEAAQRSILEFSATNGTPLQQTARHMVVSDGPGSTAFSPGDFDSAGST